MPICHLPVCLLAPVSSALACLAFVHSPSYGLVLGSGMLFVLLFLNPLEKQGQCIIEQDCLLRGMRGGGAVNRGETMSSEQSGSRGEGVQGYAGAGRWNGGGGFVKLMHTLRFCSCDMSNALYLTPGLAEILERRGFVGCHRRFPLFFTPIPSPSPPPSTHTHTLTNTQTHTQTHTHTLSLSLPKHLLTHQPCQRVCEMPARAACPLICCTDTPLPQCQPGRIESEKHNSVV